MIFFEDTEITLKNKHILSQDLTGRAIWVTLKNPDLLGSFNLISKDFEPLWSTTDEGRFLYCELIEKTSEQRSNRYEAVILEKGAQIKHWGIVTINDTWSTPNDYSDSIFIDLFGFSSIPMFRTDKYFGDQFELRIFKKSDTSVLKTKFELFEGAKLYHALKAKESRIADLNRELAHYEILLDKIEGIKSEHPELYSEVTYWKERDTKYKIAELRELIFQHPDAAIDLEHAWYSILLPEVRRGALALSETSAFLKKYKPLAENTLELGDVAIEIKSNEDGSRVWLTLFKVVESTWDYEKIEHKPISRLVIDTRKPRFRFSFDD